MLTDMLTPKNGLLLLLAAFGLAYVDAWARATLPWWPRPLENLIGFVTNFFDTLGIGSFAPTTSAYKLKNIVPDRIIPGTLNVGHTPAVIVQAFIFMSIIEVEIVTLTALIGASVAGAWLGAGVVASWPRRKIQIGMGAALLVAALLMLMTQFDLFPVGGEALGLDGMLLVVAVVGNFILGALMTLGIGMYAPSMIMISLLGMNPVAAFPIMMGSCAFLMPVGSIRFLRADAYALRPALGLVLGGIPAVLVAAFIVGSLPIDYVRWLVVVVVTYTAISMLRSARANAGLDIAADEAANRAAPPPVP
ncbi:MAG TPA: permease [Acidobacteriota bacterium]|jgi:uncharacterized membrane protein YfcA|nr:permease [Acidobacteriota bacterium]HJO29692.1 permease [Acidobacteriota bacterium]|tara:strand:+ start:11021 stop:11938 length:918 start_codon:yes stop_codon:yes gene_type:complete